MGRFKHFLQKHTCPLRYLRMGCEAPDALEHLRTALARNSSIEQLELVGCRKVWDENLDAIAGIVQGCSSLRRLRVTASPEVKSKDSRSSEMNCGTAGSDTDADEFDLELASEAQGSFVTAIAEHRRLRALHLDGVWLHPSALRALVAPAGRGSGGRPRRGALRQMMLSKFGMNAKGMTALAQGLQLP